MDSIYDHISESIRIRSKCDWYEHGEKSTKFYLNLEKKRRYQNQIRKRIFDAKERDEHVDVIDKFLCAITNLRLATAIK